MGSHQRRHGDSGTRQARVRFVVTLAAGWICGLTLIVILPGVEGKVQSLTAGSLAALRMIGMDVEVSGIAVRIGGTWAGIVPECTTLVPTILYAAAIIAFPAGWLWKGAGLLSGAALLWLYNIARIAALAILHASDARLASLAHLYLWQTMTLIVVVSLFVAWVRLQPGSAARR